MKINHMVRERYLTCGQTYDNFILYNLPKEFIQHARKSLSVSENEIKPCNIYINREKEIALEQTLDKCEEDFQKGILARTFFLSSFMREVFESFNICEYKHLSKEFLDDGINCLLSGDFEGSKKFYVMSPFSDFIRKVIRENGKVELNIFLEDTKNVYLQRAINNHFASREPFSIKLFTNLNRLPSYVSEGGQLIQDTHDYMTRDLRPYIGLEKEDFVGEM